jgi:DNA-binding NarL/FixJ family response regulator
MRPIKVMLVDNSGPFRANLKRFLQAQPDIAIAGEAGSGEEAIRRAPELSPDLILMDFRMDGIDGIEAAREITRENPGIRFVVMTIYDSDSLRSRAREAGALGYILKEEIPDKLMPCIRAEFPPSRIARPG